LSSSLIFPFSTSWRIRAAVNCFVTEPNRNLVSGAFGDPPLHVGHPVAFFEDDLPVFGHEQ